MGNYKARRADYLPAWKINCAHWMFEGRSDRWIAEELDAVKLAKITDDKTKQKFYRNWKDKLNRLRRDPKFQEYYQSIVTEWRVHSFGPALNVLNDQLKSSEPWLANKAANDVLNRIGHDPFSTGEDSSSVTIKFEGMPELGSPPAEEEDDD